MVPQGFIYEVPGPEPRGSHHSQFLTPSISPTVTESVIGTPPTRSIQRAYGNYDTGYDNLWHGLAQWTEQEHGLGLHPAVPSPGSRAHLPDTLTPVSPTTTHDTYDHSHRKCEPEDFSWQNIQTQTPPVWSQDVPSYPTQPDYPAALFRYHSDQFLASCLDPITSRNFDSNGFSDQEMRNPRTVKMETLRKRRHNISSSESGSDHRQTKSRSTRAARRKGAGTATINTQATRDVVSETSRVSKKGRKSTTVTTGPGGMLSPTSPALTSDTHETEESPHNGTNHSDDENSSEMDEAADQNTARLKHNKVERKYRDRLNNHFEQLLGVLPLSGSGRPTAAPIQPSNTTTLHGGFSRRLSSRKDRERKVSKSEVLDRARMYIQSLENEHRRLVAEQKELLQRWDEYGRANQMGPPPHNHR